MPSNVLPLRLKQTFSPIIWIFTEGEGDTIESRLPFKIFSTLFPTRVDIAILKFGYLINAKIGWFGLVTYFKWNLGILLNWANVL